MAKKPDTPEAAQKKQRMAQLRLAWQVLIVVVIAYTLAKYFKVPLPF